jgi:hypothetical protein
MPGRMFRNVNWRSLPVPFARIGPINGGIDPAQVTYSIEQPYRQPELRELRVSAQTNCSIPVCSALCSPTLGSLRASMNPPG